MISILEELNITGKHQIPVIQSVESAECGLACLAMVARYHGHNIDLSGLRQRYPISLKGMTLNGLMSIADRLCLAPRAIRTELETLELVGLPAILHWDMNHFVVLAKVAESSIVIHDPAIGRRILAKTEASKHFTGVALELTPSPAFKPIEARLPIRIEQLWSGARGISRTLAETFLLSMLLQIVTFAAPFQLQLIVDQAIYSSDRDLLVVIALGFGALILLQYALQFLRDRIVLVAGSVLGFQVTGNLVRHLLRLPSAYFGKRHLGDILSRVRSSEPIRNALTQGLVTAIIDGLMALVAVIILCVYSTLLTSIVLFFIVLYLGIIVVTYPMFRSRTLEQILSSAREQTNLMETLRGAVTIKVMGREMEREAAWRNLYAAVVNTTFSVGKLQVTISALQGAVTGLQTVLVVFLGARMVIDGSGFSVGMLIAYLSFRQTFTDRAASLLNQLMQFRLLGLHLERLGDIINTASEFNDGASPPLQVDGAIEVRQISFRYGSTDNTVIDGCTLTVHPREFVAITGVSGSGKSTLFKLMLGLFPVEGGDILLDGQAATPALWRSWRAHVGVVSQDDQLLSGTIADNIAFFDPELQMERVAKVAEAARVHADIARMPMQYMTLVGDMGTALSGGQRQRILLARALYRSPNVLFLDEGTANLDAATEAEIAQLIAEMPITRIVVAHRPALVDLADKVYRMERGRLRLVRSSRADSYVS